MRRTGRFATDSDDLFAGWVAREERTRSLSTLEARLARLAPYRPLFLAVSLAFGAAACGGTDSPTSPPTPVVASLVLGQTTLTFSSLGETVTLSASARDASGNPVSASVAWASSDPGVASVAGGVVTSVGNGSATITASSGSASATATATIQQVAAGVSVTPADGVIKAASSLSGSVVDARGHPIAGEPVTWTSLTPSIVAVDADGDLTPMDTGVGRVQVEADGFTATALVRTVWNVQVLSDLFPLFEYSSAQGHRSAFSDEDQENANARGQLLGQIWSYMEGVLPTAGTNRTDLYFTTWGEIWEEFTHFCGTFAEAREDITNWRQCNITGATPATYHFFTVENEPHDRFLIIRFIARQFVLSSYTQSAQFPWFVAGYASWLSAGDFQGADVVVDAPRSVHVTDFGTGDSGGTLATVSELLNMSSSVFFTDPEQRTPVAVKIAQSTLFFDYLADNHAGVIPGMLAMIRANPGSGVSNAALLQYITSTTGMSLAELDAAYLAHARAL